MSKDKLVWIIKSLSILYQAFYGLSLFEYWVFFANEHLEACLRAYAGALVFGKWTTEAAQGGARWGEQESLNSRKGQRKARLANAWAPYTQSSYSKVSRETVPLMHHEPATPYGGIHFFPS